MIQLQDISRKGNYKPESRPVFAWGQEEEWGLTTNGHKELSGGWKCSKTGLWYQVHNQKHFLKLNKLWVNFLACNIYMTQNSRKPRRASLRITISAVYAVYGGTQQSSPLSSGANAEGTVTHCITFQSTTGHIRNSGPIRLQHCIFTVPFLCLDT